MFVDYGALGAAVYQLTKPVGRSVDGDLEYYLEQLKTIKGPILEAGVGTGRLLIPLLQHGLNVDGVDLSADMLAICCKNLEHYQHQANLYHQDLAVLALPQKYEAIIMPTGSFGLLAPRALMKKTLHNFKNHLTADGILMIDLLLPTDFRAGELSTDYFKLSDMDGIVMTMRSLKMDWIEQTTETLIRYEKWSNGYLSQSELSLFKLAWYGIEEFILILRNEGFTEIEYRWDYEQSTETHNIATFFIKV